MFIFYKIFLLDNRKSILRYSFLSLIFISLGFILSIIFDLSIEGVLKSYSELTNGNAEKSVNDTYFNGFITIFLNNYIVCIQILLISLLPIRYLFSYFLIITNYILGILIYSVYISELSFINTLLFGLFPHYFIECFGFIISCVICSILNVNIIYRINNFLFKKSYENKNNYYKMKDLLFLVLKVYMFIILPLILLGSFIEGYISRYLSGL